MSADWLYPLSSKANYYFELKSGSTPDTSPASFEQMVRLGGIDDKWGAFKNWRNMQTGDRMWVYYGSADGDLGVVGLATIVRVTPPAVPRGRAEVILSWDRTATMQLLANPLPAAEVRKYIPHPQGAAWAVPAPLAQQLRHRAKVARTRPKPPAKGKYAESVPSTVSYTPTKSVKANLRHDAVLRPFEQRLISAGWSPERFEIGTKRADLVMRRSSELLLVEAKTIGASTNDAVRAAFAQLSEYAWLYKKGHPKGPSVMKWALFEREPSVDEVEFLEDHDLRVTWASRSLRRLIHGPGTATQAFDIGL